MAGRWTCSSSRERSRILTTVSVMNIRAEDERMRQATAAAETRAGGREILMETLTPLLFPLARETVISIWPWERRAEGICLNR